MEKQYASIVVKGFKKNSFFDISVRDNFSDPYIQLKKELLKKNIELNTADLNYDKNILFEIHFDVQSRINKNVPTFLFLFETNDVAKNNSKVNIDNYQSIYTWNDDLLNLPKFNKFRLPVYKQKNQSFESFKERKNFCCAITGNKAVLHKSKSELYTQRIKTFLWFENNYPNDFDLYGVGWGNPPLYPGYLNKIKNLIFGYLPHRLKSNFSLKSYVGPIENKSVVLSKYKFSIVYENVSSLNGYIGEKIFDCFFAGCIPVYWGAENITSYIPAECFIDRRDFDTHESLYAHLRSINEHQYLQYQLEIKKYIDSSDASLFYSEHFAKSIAKDILQNLEYVRVKKAV
jgi:alpha(1,3/1,4) fucosyltransferase